MKNAMEVVKLTSDALDSIAEKLQMLVATDENIPALAYAGDMNAVASCSCEKGCEGCTSW